MDVLFGGELSETQDMSGLSPHMVFLLSLKCGNMKDTHDEPHQSAASVTAHHLHAFNIALIKSHM